MLEGGKIVALGPACGALAGIRARWQKFPCSRTQGKRRLEPRERAGFETLAFAGSQDLDNFPVFSLRIRDFGEETSSRSTAPTAIQSVTAETSRARSGTS